MPSGVKRPGSDDRGLLPSASKVARTDNGDFSGAVKKRLSGASRTGQACDRCKVRKIRCDARPGGCTPCLQNNTECRTTDRITGRATSRGHTESIEAENNGLKAQIADLRQQLEEHGIEARAPAILPNPYSGNNETQSVSGWSQELYDLSGLLTQGTPQKGQQNSSTLPAFRAGSLGDNYLGVASAIEWLSPINGTSLSLFGMELDLKNFLPEDEDESSSLTSDASFQRLMQSIPMDPPQLPPYEQCVSFCHWFFKFVNSWLPIVHRPTFMAMIDRIYQEPNLELSIPDKIQLHTVLAIILYQYAARNPTQDQEIWKLHYRYAMVYVRRAMGMKDLPSIQAVALVLSLLRGFPRPGAAWIMSSLVLSLCVTMGLHRSVSAWKDGGPRLTAHEVELRKRIFWSVLACHVTIGSKLGRPLSIHIEDFDVELPQILHDNLPDEEGHSDWSKCSFRAGIVGLKTIAIFMQIQSTIYAVRSTPQSYEPTLKHLEREVDMWNASIPPELVGNKQSSIEDRVFALYLDFGAQQMSLLLHHPALCRTQNAELTERNLDKCLEASSKLLQIAADMRTLKSIDSTWLSNTVFIAALFTTLFIYSERKDQITSTDLNNLKANMDMWLDIMRDIGGLLGTGPRLQSALAVIIDSAIGNISKHLAAKTASAAVASAGNGNETVLDASAYSNGSNYSAAIPGQAHISASDSQTGTSYVTANQTSGPFAYPDPGNSGVTSYASNDLSYDSQGYNGDVKSDISAQLAAHNASLGGVPQHHASSRSPLDHHTEQQANTLFQAYSSPHAIAGYTNAPIGVSQGGSTGLTHASGSMAWRQFADSMKSNASPHWSANALMALGQKSNAGTGIVGAEGISMEMDPNAHWPPMGYHSHGAH